MYFYYFQRGNFIEVDEPSNLRSKMGLYYNYVSRIGSQPRVIFSVPYKGFFGLGEQTVLCFTNVLPVTQLKRGTRYTNTPS